MLLKILIILLVIVALVLYGLSKMFKRFRQMFDFSQFDSQADKNKEQNKNVVYQKDDVVILKGDADKNKKNAEGN